MNDCYYVVKVLAPNAKRWDFLTSKGGLTHLKIHASMTEDPDRAYDYAKDIIESNPGYQAKVVAWK
jgi:hypothetical protein